MRAACMATPQLTSRTTWRCGTRPASTCAATCTPTLSGRVLDLQTRHARRLPALPGGALAPLPCGVAFRYNTRIALGWNDADRTLAAIRGAEGKRLTYRQPSQRLISASPRSGFSAGARSTGSRQSGRSSGDGAGNPLTRRGNSDRNPDRIGDSRKSRQVDQTRRLRVSAPRGIESRAGQAW